jgi:hypothetical protein
MTTDDTVEKPVLREEIDLTPEDEAILDRIWDLIPAEDNEDDA